MKRKGKPSAAPPKSISAAITAKVEALLADKQRAAGAKAILADKLPQGAMSVKWGQALKRCEPSPAKSALSELLSRLPAQSPPQSPQQPNELSVRAWLYDGDPSIRKAPGVERCKWDPQKYKGNKAAWHRDLRALAAEDGYDFPENQIKARIEEHIEEH
jgi:hypothetical protein